MRPRDLAKSALPLKLKYINNNQKGDPPLGTTALGRTVCIYVSLDVPVRNGVAMQQNFGK